MRRYKMSKGGSRRDFTRNAVKKHKFNSNSARPMRGGFRL